MSAPRLRRLVLGAAVAVLAGGLTTVPAVAAPASPATPTFARAGQPVTGDLTGDGVADRVSLGTATTSSGGVCAYRLQVGNGANRFDAPVVGTLPVRGAPESEGQVLCPDLAVVLKTPKANRLAVAWFGFAPDDGSPQVQLFAGFGGRTVRYVGGVDGIFQPSVIGSRDFDGDGWGDVWESTDQGDGFAAFVGRDATWHELYRTPATGGAVEQFFDLNRAGGTDVLVSWSDLGQGAGVDAVDGRTGAVEHLGSSTPDDPSDFSASLVDIDHDAYPDVQVQETPFDGPVVVHRYLNRSRGGRWHFQAVGSA